VEIKKKRVNIIHSRGGQKQNSKWLIIVLHNCWVLKKKEKKSIWQISLPLSTSKVIKCCVSLVKCVHTLFSGPWQDSIPSETQEPPTCFYYLTSQLASTHAVVYVHATQLKNCVYRRHFKDKTTTSSFIICNNKARISLQALTSWRPFPPFTNTPRHINSAPSVSGQRQIVNGASSRSVNVSLSTARGCWINVVVAYCDHLAWSWLIADILSDIDAFLCCVYWSWGYSVYYLSLSTDGRCWIHLAVTYCEGKEGPLKPAISAQLQIDIHNVCI